MNEAAEREPTRCPECGEPVAPGAKFCAECGARIAEAPAPTAAPPPLAPEMFTEPAPQPATMAAPAARIDLPAPPTPVTLIAETNTQGPWYTKRRIWAASAGILALCVLCACITMMVAVARGGNTPATRTAVARSTGTAQRVADMAVIAAAQTSTSVAQPTATPVPPTVTPTLPLTATRTPVPTETPRPTNTVRPTNTPRPTATRVPTVDVAESTYIAWMQRSTSAVGKSLGDFGDLMNNPKLGDTTWTINVAVALSTWQTNYAEALKQTPPPRYAPAHEKYTLALEQLDSAADDVAYGIDHSTTSAGVARLNSAAGKIKLATTYIGEATALMPK